MGGLRYSDACTHTRTRDSEGFHSLVSDKQYLMPRALRSSFCTEARSVLKAKRLGPFTALASVLLTEAGTFNVFTDLTSSSLIFLTFSSQNLQGLQQLSPKWMSSPRCFQIWVRLRTKAKICSYRSQRPNLDRPKKEAQVQTTEEMNGNGKGAPSTSYNLKPHHKGGQSLGCRILGPTQTGWVRTDILTDPR